MACPSTRGQKVPMVWWYHRVIRVFSISGVFYNQWPAKTKKSRPQTPMSARFAVSTYWMANTTVLSCLPANVLDLCLWQWTVYLATVCSLWKYTLWCEQDLCKLLHIHQLRTTSYRPSGNGRCEIMNRTLHALLAKVVSEKQKNWSYFLPHCMWAYNTSRHSSTGFLPFFLMHSRLPYTAIDLLLDRPKCEADTSSYHEFA